jgi:hypothetical protein
MRKLIVVLAAAAALAATSAAPASARGCRTVKCFNNRITTLQSEVVELAGALHCLQPVPVTRYGGYDYNGYVGASTALDITESGDAVSTWVVGIAPGSCGSPQTRNAAAARSASKSPSTAARDASPFGAFQAIPGSVERGHGVRP